MEQIDSFNREEVAFKFEESQYPMRKQIHDKLTPYKKLYDNSIDFVAQHAEWMNAKVGTYFPDDIEAEVALYYRNVYKLEKVFSDKPATFELATCVSMLFDSAFSFRFRF